jgi:hypothetical protein
MIKVTADMSSIMKSYHRIHDSLTSLDKMGKIMQLGAEMYQVRNIKQRLNVRTGTSGYEMELKSTMKKLDEQFVNMLSGNYSVDAADFGSSGWANRTEAERRVKGGGYRKGRITKAIERTIRASQPFKIVGGIAVGIGAYEELDNLFPQLGVEDTYKLWQILNYGVGTVGAGGSPVIRTGKQVFYNRKIRKGVLAYRTSNPGFKGREFFVKMDGSMHQADIATRNYIINYMRQVLK